MSGAFLMSREIFSHDIWNDVPKFRIFFYIVGNAVFSKKGVIKGGVQIGRGQYLRSYRNIREDLLYIENNAEKYYALSMIKKKIDDLVNHGMLTIEETKLGTLFTVVNYHKYQGFESYKGDSSEQQKNAVRTAEEQPENNKNYVKKGIKGNKKDSRRKRVYDTDSPEFKIAEFFYQEILKNNPKHKKPDLQKWANDIRLLLEIDGRDKSEVSRLIRWVQQDSFEMANVLSPAKLRKRYDALIMKMNKPVTDGKTGKPVPKSKDVKEFEMDITRGE